MKARCLALALAAAGCADKPAAPAPEARSSLRVPLPDGWRATAVASGLHVGPKGRVVLQLESTPRPLPTPAAFLAALEAQGVAPTQKEVEETFVGARYPVEDREGFLGVKQTGPRTIWCSTTAQASAEDVAAAMGVCRGLTWDGEGGDR